MYFQLVYKELCKSQVTAIQAHTDGYVSNSGLPVSKQSEVRSEATTAVSRNNGIKYECASYMFCLNPAVKGRPLHGQVLLVDLVVK
jgi:hypothetical protein